MRIVVVNDWYSCGMGYTENCLPKALAALGSDVHVVVSNLNVYGNSADYRRSYERFLGPPEQSCGESEVDGYTLHRLPHRLRGGYIVIRGLIDAVTRLSPDIVQCISTTGWNYFQLALFRRKLNCPLFTECHQHLSIVRPYLLTPEVSLRRATYWATRTLPGRMAARAIVRCYAIAPDCADVAHRFYGVPKRKIRVLPLGSDTDLFHPVICAEDQQARDSLRKELGMQPNDIVCIYTGRLSDEKNPLLLAEAVTRLRSAGKPFRSLFVGNGPQKERIEAQAGSKVVSFVPYPELGKYYRAAEIGVWPTQESMSMLDAASTGLPVVASDRIGDPDRLKNSGVSYREGDSVDLAAQLQELQSAAGRKEFGNVGRTRIVDLYSWLRNAETRMHDYVSCV